MGCEATPGSGPSARIAASYLVSDYKKNPAHVRDFLYLAITSEAEHFHVGANR